MALPIVNPSCFIFSVTMGVTRRITSADLADTGICALTKFLQIRRTQNTNIHLKVYIEIKAKQLRMECVLQKDKSTTFFQACAGKTQCPGVLV